MQSSTVFPGENVLQAEEGSTWPPRGSPARGFLLFALCPLSLLAPSHPHCFNGCSHSAIFHARIHPHIFNSSVMPCSPSPWTASRKEQVTPHLPRIPHPLEYPTPNSYPSFQWDNHTSLQKFALITLESGFESDVPPACSHSTSHSLHLTAILKSYLGSLPINLSVAHWTWMKWETSN